jgi:hypothetical protein
VNRLRPLITEQNKAIHIYLNKIKNWIYKQKLPRTWCSTCMSAIQETNYFFYLKKTSANENITNKRETIAYNININYSKKKYRP